ncbi:hypothetical protein VTK73DRAFT_1509 [Phialemonium thermophilum]|uniref:Uncharacterized protein n=1 Tax=Phialemonium thermophilum TaxID=223376 RepID=A0ABR3VTF1_9PEZI
MLRQLRRSRARTEIVASRRARAPTARRRGRSARMIGCGRSWRMPARGMAPCSSSTTSRPRVCGRRRGTDARRRNSSPLLSTCLAPPNPTSPTCPTPALRPRIPGSTPAASPAPSIADPMPWLRLTSGAAPATTSTSAPTMTS